MFKSAAPFLSRSIELHAFPERRILALGLAVDLISMAKPFIYMALIDSLMGSVGISSLVAMVAILVVMAVAEFTFGLARDQVSTRAATQAASTFSFEIWDKIVRARRGFFGRWAPGDILQRIDALNTFYTSHMGVRTALIVAIPVLVALTACIFLINPLLSLVLVFASPVIGVWTFAMGRKRLRLLNATFDHAVGAKSAGVEIFQANELLQSLDRTEYGFAKAWNPLHATNGASLSMSSISLLSSRGATLSQSVVAALLLLVAAVLVSRGVATIGQLVAFDMFAGQIRNKVLILAGLNTLRQNAAAADQRIKDMVVDLAAGSCPRHAVTQAQKDCHSELSREILIDGLTFAYENSSPLLSDLSLSLRPCQRIAVMGPSGVGKSTLGRILAGIERADSMHLRSGTVDVIDIAGFLGRHVLYLPQEPQIFSGTVAENAFLAQPEGISKGRLAEAQALFQEVGLGALWPIGSPFGIYLRPDGQNLSGGQKQRLHICRALLSRPSILVIDEPTSALDVAGAAAMLDLVERVHADATLIYITHDTAIAARCHEVLHLVSGHLSQTTPSRAVRSLQA